MGFKEQYEYYNENPAEFEDKQFFLRSTATFHLWANRKSNAPVDYRTLYNVIKEVVSFVTART